MLQNCPEKFPSKQKMNDYTCMNQTKNIYLQRSKFLNHIGGMIPPSVIAIGWRFLFPLVDIFIRKYIAVCTPVHWL